MNHYAPILTEKEAKIEKLMGLLELEHRKLLGNVRDEYVKSEWNAYKTEKRISE